MTAKRMLEESALCEAALAQVGVVPGRRQIREATSAKDFEALVREYGVRFESYLYDGNDKDFEKAIKHAGIDKMPPEVAKVHRAAMQKAKDTIKEPYGESKLAEAKNKSHIFGYYVNKDERGEFYADVRDLDDESVYEVKSDDETGEVPEVEDGFMRNTSDIAGLEKHLKMLNIIGHNAKLMDSSDFEEAKEEWENAEDEMGDASESRQRYTAYDLQKMDRSQILKLIRDKEVEYKDVDKALEKTKQFKTLDWLGDQLAKDDLKGESVHVESASRPDADAIRKWAADKWGKKESRWADAPVVTSADVKPVAALIAKLPVVGGPPSPMDEFEPHFLEIIKANGNLAVVLGKRNAYLIDTQGYDYPRYLLAVPRNLAKGSKASDVPPQAAGSSRESMKKAEAIVVALAQQADALTAATNAAFKQLKALGYDESADWIYDAWGGIQGADNQYAKKLIDFIQSGKTDRSESRLTSATGLSEAERHKSLEVAGEILDKGESHPIFKRIDESVQGLKKALKETQDKRRGLIKVGAGKTEDDTIVRAHILPAIRDLAEEATSMAKQLDQRLSESVAKTKS